ncbi:MAG TPA: glycoside hydrolase family 20 zincin-like fold domain-containing protein [Herpetosiphonaceae bacterium]
MDARPPILIPQPHSFEWSSGSFGFDAQTHLVLGPHAGADTIFAARTLQSAISSMSSLRLPIVKTTSPANQRSAIRLILQGRDDAESQRDGGEQEALGPQAYHLVIAADGVVITAADEAGLFYGVQTLIQFVRIHGRRLPCCICADRPSLPRRGVMLDISRGKVPKLATLERLADMLAHYKINELQLYTEHTFRFPSHPRIGLDCGSLSADDMLALDAVCRARHIALVPNLQSTGHMRHILSLPEYEHLAETPWRWSITPARDESYHFLDELYADFLPAFSTPILNVNSDEAWDHGRGQARVLSAEIGYGRVYLNHILKLHELATRHGRQMMIWADVFHHYPELIAEIPADVILLDWEYEGQPTYPTLEALAGSGRPFYVCPGTSSWNTLFPRIENSLINIRNYVRDGVAAGAIGMLLTDWGDLGHYQPLSHSWYSYLFGAEMAWSGAATATEVFDRAFGPLFLGDASGQAVAAMQRLGRAVEQPGLALPNRSDTVYALYDEPLLGRTLRSAPPEALHEMIAAAEAAMPAFALLSDSLLRHELLFTAHQMIYAAKKVLLGQAIHRALHDLSEATEAAPDGLARLDALIADMERLSDALPPMVAEFEQLWLLSAHRSEIDLNLQRYAALIERFDAALRWLREQRDGYAAGRALDVGLTTYNPGEYLVLWDEGHQDLHRLVNLVGRDAVPPEILRWLDLAS